MKRGRFLVLSPKQKEHKIILKKARSPWLNRLCYSLTMNKTPAKNVKKNVEVKKWTKKFIEKYTPALQELAKK